MLTNGRRLLVGLYGLFCVAHSASGADVFAEKTKLTLEQAAKLAWDLQYALKGELALTNSPSPFFLIEDYGRTHTGLFFLDSDVRSLEENGYNRVSLPIEEMTRFEQRLAKAKSAKKQLDEFFSTFDFDAQLQQLQREYDGYVEKIERSPSAPDRGLADISKREIERKISSLKILYPHAMDSYKKVPDLIARYEASIAGYATRLKPFVDQAEAEANRKAERKSLYRQHIEKVISQAAAFSGHCFSSDSGTVIVEPVVTCENGVLSVMLRLVVYPFSEATISSVHVYDQNGQHLGLPISQRLAAYNGKEWAEYGQFETAVKGKDGVVAREYIINQSFRAEKMPAQGKLKLLITGKNVKVEYATDYKTDANNHKAGQPVNLVSEHPSVTSSTKTIKCRREGNHLWVPVEIGSGSLMQQTELLLDTGASVTCIPANIYERLGRGNATHRKIQLETANGLISADTDVLLVKTSAFERDIRVAFNSSNKLLGANYFADCIFTVDVNNECIYVKRSGIQVDEYRPLTNGK